MKGFLNLMGMTLGGWIGWELGILLSLFTAFLLSVLGTGIGLYASQRVLNHLLP